MKLTKKVIALISVILITASLFLMTSCGKKKQITIAIPNDTTNEARALLMLQDLGYIKLKKGADITATVRDVESNPYNIKFNEVEAAQIPNIRKDVDFAIINSNFAIAKNINPSKDALALESKSSAYANILAVKQGRENDPLILALKAALQSKEVSDFIKEKYSGAVLSTVDKPGSGFDENVNYNALAGKTITVAASPAPHAEILAIAKAVLVKKSIKLEIKEYTDYIIPNKVVEDATVDANYFQHLPYLKDFNEKNNTHLVSVGAIHVEPLGIYGGKQSSLDVIKKAK